MELRSVQKLNLSTSDGLPTITGDELWRQCGPKTLEKPNAFKGRAGKVVKVILNSKLVMKKVVQQTLLLLKPV